MRLSANRKVRAFCSKCSFSIKLCSLFTYFRTVSCGAVLVNLTRLSVVLSSLSFVSQPDLCINIRGSKYQPGNASKVSKILLSMKLRIGLEFPSYPMQKKRRPRFQFECNSAAAGFHAAYPWPSETSNFTMSFISLVLAISKDGVSIFFAKRLSTL